MKKALILVVSLFQFVNLYSQIQFDIIDSTIEIANLNENDWILALSIEQVWLPIMDSSGNSLNDDPNGIYIVRKIGNRCSLQKIDNYFNGAKLTYKIDQSINIADSKICNYTIDSIKKSEKEWILPNIYKDDSLNVYEVQEKGNHSPSFKMCFRTKQSTRYSNFDDIDVFTPEILKSWYHKNLNYDHNSNTFIYRAFMNFIDLLKKHYRVQVLE